MRAADTDVPKFVLVPKQTEIEVFYHNPLHRELAALVQYRIRFRDEATIPSEATDSELLPTRSEKVSSQPFTADNVAHQIYDSYCETPIGDYALQQDLFFPRRPPCHNGVEAVASGDAFNPPKKTSAARFFNPKPIPHELGKIMLYNPSTAHPVSTMLGPFLNRNSSALYDSLRHHACAAGFAFGYIPPPSVTTKNYTFVWNDIDISSSFGGPASMSGKCNFVDPASKSTRITVAKLYIYNLDKLLYPSGGLPSASDEMNNEIVLIEDNIRLLDVDVDRKGFEASLLLSVFLIATANERARGMTSREKRMKKDLESAERAEREQVRVRAEADAKKKREQEKADAKAREELRKNEEFARTLQEKEQAKADKERLRMEREGEKYAKMLAARETEARRKDEELARKLQNKEERELARTRRSDEEFARRLQMQEDGNSSTRSFGMKLPKFASKLSAQDLYKHR
ncbi:hypothetical protein V1508DRAFT_419135 [Lipomyces doorenjongii]|uniref:uncharacterized protein n=1 Tax=Lipomyces doorenjongii TaxID=383834 RepID=UPI0034CFF6C8